ncbi:MAG: PAS domain S-box protein [Chloroflexi bacterium]|nr:PAS domain S-box protein [Chloroflexota bacterium]
MKKSEYQKHAVPEGYMEKWQKTINLIAEIFDVPTALIMRVSPEEIEVLVSSLTEGNPYKPHEMADLGTGLYCETVMAEQAQLLVPNALDDPDWENNPDVKLNMIHYLGVPLIWPNGSVFGTLCILDNKTRRYSKAYEKLLHELKGIIEGDFNNLLYSQSLEEHKVELENQVEKRTAELKITNNQLDVELAERKQAEGALRESEVRYRTLFEHANDAIFLENENDEIVDINRQACELMGYTRDELLGMTVPELQAPEIRGKKGTVIKQEMKKHGGSVFETVNIHHNGTRIPLEVSTAAMHGQDAGLVLTIVRDITERKEAEKVLRESEERYRNIYERVEDVIYETDFTGRFTGISPSIEKHSGYRPDELIGRNVLDFYADQDEYVALNEAMEADGSVNDFELHLKKKNGESIIASITAHIVFDEGGKPVKTEGVLRDITERKQADETLRESERQLSTLMANLPGIAYRCLNDANWTMEFLSSGCYALTGYQSSELVDNNDIAYADLIHPADQEDVWDKVQAALDTQSPFEIEYRIITANGDQKYVWEKGSGVFNGKQLLFLEGFITDITVRKQALDAIQQYIKQLDALREIDQAIINSFDLSVTMNILLDYVISHLDVDAVAVLKHNESTQTFDLVHKQGFCTQEDQLTNLRLRRGQVGKEILRRNSIFIPDLTQGEINPFDFPDYALEGFLSYYGVPLITRGALVGVLEIFHRSALDSGVERDEYLQMLAGQAAIAINNVALFENLERSNIKLLEAYDATIEGWAQALELRDMETEGHSRRVVKTTVELAKMLGFSGSDLTHVRRGALLHDIGKMGIPDHILQKPDELNDDERQVMEMHPALAYEWLSSIEYLRPAMDIPYYHHEKWDGTGYPRGLKGEQIPLAARIFAVVDVWDALRSDRAYRKMWSREKTLAYIKKQSGTHLDPKVVAAFLKYIENEGEFR